MKLEYKNMIYGWCTGLYVEIVVVFEGYASVLNAIPLGV